MRLLLLLHHESLLHFNLRDDLFLVELRDFLPFGKGFIEASEGLELSEHCPVELIHALESAITYCLLVVCEEEPAEVLVQEEISGVVFGL